MAASSVGNIRIKFVDETGEDEKGMDIGGPFKEVHRTILTFSLTLLSPATAVLLLNRHLISAVSARCSCWSC